MCRHTIGLNWTAVGIEHVGISDRDILGNRRQLAASLRLTRWLQDRLGIRTRNVIGHAESLSSPYHHERIRALARRTHGDFRRATMRRYRRLLERGAAQARTPARVALGRSVRGRTISAVRSGDAGRTAQGARRRLDPRQRDRRHRDRAAPRAARPPAGHRAVGGPRHQSRTAARGARGRTRAAST